MFFIVSLNKSLDKDSSSSCTVRSDASAIKADLRVDDEIVIFWASFAIFDITGLNEADLKTVDLKIVDLEIIDLRAVDFDATFLIEIWEFNWEIWELN